MSLGGGKGWIPFFSKGTSRVPEAPTETPEESQAVPCSRWGREAVPAVLSQQLAASN